MTPKAEAHRDIERAYCAAINTASGGTGKTEDVPTCETCHKSGLATGEYLSRLKVIIVQQAETIGDLRGKLEAHETSEEDLEAHPVAAWVQECNGQDNPPQYGEWVAKRTREGVSG